MLINATLINSALEIAQEIFSNQSVEEFQKMQEHFGKAFNETKIVAEIAVKLVLRIGGIEMQANRDITPITPLVFDAEKLYRERYGVE